MLHSLSTAQWTQIYDGGEPYALLVNDNYIFAAANDGELILRSRDHGTTWDTVNTGLTDSPGFTDVTCLAANATDIYAGTYGQGVFLSTNNGASWAAVDTAHIIPYPDWLMVKGSNLYAGAYNGVFLSTNNGVTWVPIDTVLGKRRIGLFFLNDSISFAILTPEGNEGQAGTPGAFYRSTDGGTHWETADSGISVNSTTNVGLFAVVGTTLYAYASDFSQTQWDIYSSTDYGASWNSIGQGGLPDSAWFSGTIVRGNNIFAGGDDIYLSKDGCANWTRVGTGLPNGTSTYILAVDSIYLYAGTQESPGSMSGGIWRRPLSEMVTTVKNRPGTLPENFVLMQNYPNPFNPSTIISYQLPSNCYVSLKVFDVLGRQVETLVNGLQSAGIYSVKFNAANFPSGVYFYRLDAGTYHDNKKLLLLK